jgi:hypothetical protein
MEQAIGRTLRNRSGDVKSEVLACSTQAIPRAPAGGDYPQLGEPSRSIAPRGVIDGRPDSRIESLGPVN